MQVLQGIKVVDLSRYISGPNCCQMLGDLGADVIKVESPKGEPVREYEPTAADGTGFYYMVFNRNKRGVTLNTRTEAGREVLRRLLAEADVVVENFKPGTMDAMGFSWQALQQLNPRLVMVSISGFGQSGPMAALPGFDSIMQATGGMMSLTGAPDGEPTLSGTFLIDYCTSSYCATATLAALMAREKTGRGQRVEASLLDTAMSLLVDAVPEDLVLGKTRTRIGNLDKCTAPVGCFEDKNGEYVYIIAAPQAHWEKLAHLIGHPELIEDPRFATVPIRHSNAVAVNAYVQGWVSGHTRDEVVAILGREGIPAAPVLTVHQFLRLPQVAHNGQIIQVPYKGVGEVPMQGFPFKLSDTPPAINRGAPNLGEHNDEVLQGLGFSAEEIAAMRESGAI